MQKLLTIYIDRHAYFGKKMLRGHFADKHGFVEEHLKEYLEDGWKVVSLFGFGEQVGGWITVVIEKD